MGKEGQVCVAITGWGNSVARLLVQRMVGDSRYRVVIVDPEGGGGDEVRHYPVDLSQPGGDERVAEIVEAEGVGVFVHLGLSTRLSRTPTLQHEVETQTTLHVLSACGELGVRKVVLMSTTMLYGAVGDNSAWLGEDDELRADRGFQFFADKIEAEEEFREFGERHEGRIVTVLRVGPMLGPNTVNVLSGYVGGRIVPMLAGFDPPVQIVHEVDVVRAFLMVLGGDYPGVFNVVSDAVVPLATAVRILGNAPVPVVEPVAPALMGALWGFRLGGLHPAFLPYLKYPFLASGERAAEAFGFTASYPPVEILGDFARAMTRKRLEGRV